MKKEAIIHSIDRRGEWLSGLSDAIWDHPELAFHETFAADLLCDALRQEGDGFSIGASFGRVSVPEEAGTSAASAIRPKAAPFSAYSLYL